MRRPVVPLLAAALVAASLPLLAPAAAARVVDPASAPAAASAPAQRAQPGSWFEPAEGGGFTTG